MFLGGTNTLSILLQISFQAVLATDGNISFAIFNYETGNDIIRAKDVTKSIGFDAGDKMSYLTPRINDDIGIFRIDGK